ncbi:MAG: hypothetical protein F6J87_30200 [Spirulina sp. SIO3F2]|nr:hypothetical protein [Spirulina sp. SIO3F2]
MGRPKRDSYADTLAFYKRKAKECPKGVRLNLQRQKTLRIQFTNPTTGKPIVRSANEPFTDEGIINAINKCWDIKDALKRFDSDGEFWAWFDREIVGNLRG